MHATSHPAPEAPATGRIDTALAFLLGCLPFCIVVRLPPSPGFWGQWLGASLVLLWLAARPARVSAIPWGAVPFFAVAALLLVQLLAGMVAMPTAALVAVALLVVAGWACSATFSSRATTPPQSFVDAFAWGLVAALALNAVSVAFGLAGYEFFFFWLYEAPPLSRAVGLLGHANHLGVLAAFAAFAAFHLYARARLPTAALWALTVVAAAVCAASGSRIALVVWSVSAALTTLWLRGDRVHGARPAAALRRQLALLALVFVVVQGLWLARPVAPTDAAPSLARSDAGRAQMLHDALGLWMQHPVFGVGQGNYASRRLHDLDGPLPAPHSDNAHNLYAHALAEWGLVGGGLALAATAGLLWIVGRRLRDADRSADDLFAATWIVGVLAHSLVEHPLWFVHFLMPFAAMVGVLRQPSLLTLPPRAPRRRAAVAATAALALGASAATAWDYGRSQSVALAILVEVGLPAGSPAVVRAAEVARVDAFTLFPLYARLQLTRKLPLGGPASEPKLALARQAMDAIPNPETIARYAAFAVVAGKADEAGRLLDAFARRNPVLSPSVDQMMDAWAAMDPRIAAFVRSRRAAPGAAGPPAAD